MGCLIVDSLLKLIKERSEFFVVYQTNLSMSGPAHGHAFERLTSLRLGSDIHAVFTWGNVHSGYLHHSQVWLIWGGGGTLAGSACRVKSVRIGRQAISQEWRG